MHLSNLIEGENKVKVDAADPHHEADEGDEMEVAALFRVATENASFLRFEYWLIFIRLF